MNMDFNPNGFAAKANDIFDKAVADYHITDSIDAAMPAGGVDACCGLDPALAALLYSKCWIDAAQWHMEDLIRVPDIDLAEAVALKRRIDSSNQERTDMVERLDSMMRDIFSSVTPLPDATINTESPAWAIDRLSILALKIWHMAEQADRADASDEHRLRARARLEVLLEQRRDLSGAIDTLLEDIAAGRKYMKVYRQMKLYNDPSTNPALYGRKK